MASGEKLILAIDTAGSYFGIALWSNQRLYQRNWQGDGKQQEMLTQAMQGILEESGILMTDVHLIAVMRGPGTFTGLRVGMAMGKAFAYALSIPLVSIPTLKAYSIECAEHQYSAVILDARKGRYYVQLYHYGRSISEELDITGPEIESLMLQQQADRWCLTGYGAKSFADTITENNLNCFFSSNNIHHAKAHTLIELAWSYYEEYGADALDQGPTYLRSSQDEQEILARDKL